MSNNLKFEFEFDEVFEGIKQGVIRELSETNFEEAKSSAINQLKSEIKHKIYLTYSDENELKNEIKKEIKDKVFEKLLSEAKTEYKKYYEDLFNKNIVSEFNKTEKEVEADIKTKTINRLYNDLYSDIQTEMNDKIQIVIKKLMNSIGGNNLKIKGTDKILSKDEYEDLVHRSETLTALEQGGVDNWEWYGESMKNYFKGEEE
jgi:hypothetical protein